jgi:endonuclease III
MINKKKISLALIAYFNEMQKTQVEKPKDFTPDEKANALILSNPLAYLFAVILDQGIKAERAWEIPYILKQRLGTIDIHKLALISDKKIISAFNQLPKLHRFPKTMALRIKKASQLVIDRYSGKAENIWNDTPSSFELHHRFEEFAGIGQKKASMATNILVKDFNIKVKDKRGIDISYDIHIRRVLLRTGLIESDTMETVVNTARALNPEYPGIIDGPCWRIGRMYCHPTLPSCNRCPIEKVCEKRTIMK